MQEKLENIYGWRIPKLFLMVMAPRFIYSNTVDSGNSELGFVTNFVY